MNKVVKKILLGRNKLTNKMHLMQPGFTYSALDHLPKRKRKNTKNSKKQKMGDIFIKMNYAKTACINIWLYGLWRF